MSNSVISSLTALLDREIIRGMASRIGQSEESVSRALEPTLSAILTAMAAKTSDPGVLRYTFDMIRGVPAASLRTTNLINLALNGAAGSPLFDMGRRLLPVIFEGDRTNITEPIEKTSGLNPGGEERIMAATAPVLLGFLAKHVHQQEMDVDEFSEFCAGEASYIEKVIPGTGVPDNCDAHRSRSLLSIVAGLALLGVLLWFTQRISSARIEVNRSRAVVTNLGEFVERRLPGGVTLSIPEKGLEARLLSSIQGSAPANSTNWFDFDRLTFAAGSALIRPESEEQLQNVAAIMKAYPDVRLQVAGYVDDAEPKGKHEAVAESC